MFPAPVPIGPELAEQYTKTVLELNTALEMPAGCRGRRRPPSALLLARGYPQ
ncbi:MAG: hypothetical protein ACYC6N_00245 [Pirellulaceae bacterium]